MATEATRVRSYSCSLNGNAKTPDMQVLRKQVNSNKPEYKCSSKHSLPTTSPNDFGGGAYRYHTAESNSYYSTPRRSSKVPKPSRRRIKVATLLEKLNVAKKPNSQEDYHHIYSSQENSREDEEADDLSSHGKVFDLGILGGNDCYSDHTISDKYQPKLLKDIAGHGMVIKAITNAIQNNKIVPFYLFFGPSGTGKTSTARILAMALNCQFTSSIKPCWTCQGCSRSQYIMHLCSGTTITRLKRIRTLLQSTSPTQATPRFRVFIIEECDSISPEAWDELSGIANRPYSSTLVFIFITTNADMVPRMISSRCQKFFFPKLRDIDIMLKLNRIVAQEGIKIEREALKLVTAKAQGSLREAENILDQLTLLGPRITSSMTQQLVGLLPHDKLSDLLTMALSGDTVQTVRFAKQLIETGIEPQVFVSQLVSHITDTLSSEAVAVCESSSSAHLSTEMAHLQHGLQLKNTQSERMCSALQILVAIEKQAMSSVDQTSKIFTALLQIASIDASNKKSSGTVLSPELQWHNLSHRGLWTIHNAIDNNVEQEDGDNTKQNSTIKSSGKNIKCRGKSIDRETQLTCICEMEEIWLNTLDRIESTYMKHFLHHRVKLASLTITTANAILHLTFKRPEDKQTAQMTEEKLSETLENAIGCPVILNMSLEPMDMKISDENLVPAYETQLIESSHCNQYGRTFLPEFIYEADPAAATHHSSHISSVREQAKGNKADGCKMISKEQDKTSVKETTIAQQQEILPSAECLRQENQLEASADSITPRMDTNRIMRAQKPKHKWLSLSSEQHGDASIEPYSQDILFDNAKTRRNRGTRQTQKLRKGYLKVKEDDHSQHDPKSRGLYCSWSCKEISCHDN